MQDRAARKEARFVDPLGQKQMPKRRKWNLWNRTGGYSRLCIAEPGEFDVAAVSPGWQGWGERDMRKRPRT